ncbi:MAG: sensor histidine kinase, partial [Bacteroidales bacterium]|nr:sensor histidine kinase [Bacteroidales bacterium]
MIRLLALIISIALQIVAASIALRFMRLTKYRLSWILLSISFTLMAVQKTIQLVEFTSGDTSPELEMVDAWMGTFISVMIFAGVILIRELFFSLKKAEYDRIRSERRVLHAIITTEEKERKRFAKDLHDGLGPLLSTVKMSVSALSARITEPTDREILNNATVVVNEAITTIKDISNILSPHVLSNFGLLSATNSFASKISKAGAIKIEITSNLGKERFNSDTEVVLYRAACELINNSVKHSGASRIGVELNKHGNFIILQVQDNGHGFDNTLLENEEGRGMGLSNIETRVKSVNGVFIMETTPGNGMQAIIRINLTEN